MTKARCPGHITGFFEICQAHSSNNIENIGSKGAGVCIKKGVETELKIAKSNEMKIEIEINGKPNEAPVTKSVVTQFQKLKNMPFSVQIKHFTEVPMSAGFGASGAGALSTAFALNKELKLNLSRNAVATIAHIAEVENQTGLGDVIAQTFGGVEIRLEPGAPGIGRIDSIIVDTPYQVICVTIGKLQTKAILSDPKHQKRINRAGRNLVQKLVQNATIENLMRLSKKFMEEADLLSEKLRDLLQYIEDIHPFPTSMVMLGESLFTFADKSKSAELCDQIQEYSSRLTTFYCDIDYIGPRIIEA
ncbi:MAG: pantoate kinase [Candidatus Helarchaeota archaeon]